jgi:pyruvate kinase
MGPAVASKAKIEQLIDAGMNCARLNFSHGSHEEHGRVIALLKAVRQERGIPLAIMLDTKGPEIRIGSLPNGELILRAEEQLPLSSIPISPEHIRHALRPGMNMIFDDGAIFCDLLEGQGGELFIRCKNGGVLKSNKGVHLPGVQLNLPAVTEQDIRDITFGCSQDVDLIAASFISCSEHILEIKKLLVSLGKPHIALFAKIESELGVANFESILEVADGIMIARGDLGVELPLQHLPVLQKMMIRTCNEMCKPIITATQMLESMTEHPRPTRAEVSDVANAIYDSTSAVMLSGETAIGKFPIETVIMMRDIIKEAEKDCDYRAYFEQANQHRGHNVSLAVALASVQMAYHAEASAIFASSSSGFTVNLISSCRPEMPIIAQTPCAATYHRLALTWGVYPIPPMVAEDVRSAILACSCFALHQGWLRWGDRIVMTAGYLFGVPGTTNMMLIENIGNVIVRGSPGYGSRIFGQISLQLSRKERRGSIPSNMIVILYRCDEEMIESLRGVAGIILQNHPQDVHSEKCAIELAKKLNCAVVVRAAAASAILQDGMSVTIDPERGLVFQGEVRSDQEMISSSSPHL